MVPQKDKRPADDDLLDWFTVSYRSVYVAVGAILALVGGAFYFYYRSPAPPAGVASPSPAGSPTTTRFTAIEGNVLVRRAGSFDWIEANKGMVLHGGDMIRPTSGGTAEITCFDGTVIQLRPGALMTIERTYEDSATKARSVSALLSAGAGTIQTTRKNVPASKTEIATPTVKGTVDEMSHAAVDVAESGESDLRSLQGSIRAVTKEGQTIQLGPSEGLKVSAAGRAGPKVSLPDIPVLVAPPHQMEVVYPDPRLNTTILAWKVAKGAASYHLMLDYSAHFNRPLVDRKEIRENQQEIRGLDVGKYYWRVAAIGKDGVEGGFSGFFGFTVARPSRQAEAGPPLRNLSLDLRSNILQVKGNTEPGGTITVNGQRVEVAVDGRFNDFVTLQTAGRQIVVIRATGLNGGVTEERRSVVVGGP